MDWRVYAISLGVGLLVGALYAGIGVRSPAPPVIALLGLLGMLAGETLVGMARDRISAREAAAACLHAKSFTVAKTDKALDQETKA